MQLSPSDITVTGVSVTDFSSIVQHHGAGGGGSSSIGGDAPAGSGDVGGGGAGGGSGVDTNTGGSTIGNEVGFNWPSANSGSWTNASYVCLLSNVHVYG